MRSRLALACVVMLVGVFLVGGVALAEGFRGTSGPDNITGTEGKDRIWGKGGDDRLSGRSGADRIDGGNGADVMRGGNGNDYIIANDERRDTIYCGDGTDFVYASPTDVVYYGCETIRIDRSK